MSNEIKQPLLYERFSCNVFSKNLQFKQVNFSVEELYEAYLLRFYFEFAEHQILPSAFIILSNNKVAWI